MGIEQYETRIAEELRAVVRDLDQNNRIAESIVTDVRDCHQVTGILGEDAGRKPRKEEDEENVFCFNNSK